MDANLSVTNDNLTQDAISYIYDKLLNPDTTYCGLLFDSYGYELPLRLYSNDTTYIESTEESFTITNGVITLTYKFLEINSPINITRIALYNGNTLLINIPNLQFSEITSNRSNPYGVINKVTLSLSFESLLPIIPTTSKLILLDAIIDKNNIKLNKIYLGNGTPDLSGNSSVLTNKIYEFDITYPDEVLYYDTYVTLRKVINTENIVNQTITEIGVGYDTENSYQLCTLQSCDFDVSHTIPLSIIMYNLTIR